MILLYRILNLFFGLLFGYFVLIPVVIIISLGLKIVLGVELNYSLRNFVNLYDLDLLWDPKRMLNYIKFGDLD